MPARMVNTHEAKTRLSELIRAVEAGEEVILARNGRAVAKLIAWPERASRREPGIWRGRVHIHGDIVTPDPEVQAMFDDELER